MGLLTDTIAEMGRRNLPNYREVTPRLCVSLAAHALNLRHNGFRVEGGLVTHDSALESLRATTGSSMRVHTMIIGEPGTGKDIWYDQLFGKVGVCRDYLPSTLENQVTNAGLVGFKEATGGGAWKWSRGSLDKKRHHLLYWGEFDNVMKAARTQHSGGIINTLLAALDKGKVSINQGGVDDNYDTFASVIACNQPQRFEDVSGFDRRFVFVRNPPPEGEMAIVYKRKFTEHARGEWMLDKGTITSLQDRWAERLGQAVDLHRVRNSQELEDFVCESINVPVPLLGIIYNAAAAYHFLDCQGVSSDLIVPLSPGIEKLIREITSGKAGVNIDPRLVELLQENETGKTALKAMLKREGLADSLMDATKAIESCLSNHAGEGLRVVRVHKPGSRHVDIPTGLPREHFERNGAKVLGEFDWQGNSLVEEEPSG